MDVRYVVWAVGNVDMCSVHRITAHASIKTPACER